MGRLVLELTCQRLSRPLRVGSILPMLTRPEHRVIGWGRGEVWSSRRPVKPEVAGSNPVAPANLTPGSKDPGVAAPATVRPVR